jgi:predicted DCC family thiol-disulfide oxidoreductase YuxK
MKTGEHAVVLFDGVCNLCNSSVNFVLERDTTDHFRFGSLQSDEGKALLEKYSVDQNETESVILIENDKAFTYSTAAIRIARGIGGIWAAFYIFILVPKFLRDAVYKIVAKNRYRWFGKQDTCRIPRPEEINKFI